MSVWESLVGQEDAAQTLREAAKAGGESHAWLITGPAGSGRSIAARCFAAALQCTARSSEAGPGCGECENCRAVMAGTHLDVTEMSTDKVEITAKEVVSLLETAQMAPIASDHRILIVEDADRIRDLNGNRLLKAIEEPPEKTTWILCAPTPEDLLVTIRSRCRSLRLRAPSIEEVASLLADQEEVSYEEARIAAQVCQSHVGLARAMVRDPSSREKRVALMRLALGTNADSTTSAAVADAATLIAEAKKVAEKTSADLDDREKIALLDAYGLTEDEEPPRDVAAALKVLLADQKRRRKRSLADTLDRVCLDLLSFFRDAIIAASGADVSAINADMIDLVGHWRTRDTAAAVSSVEEARARLLTNTAPLLIMEALLIAIRQSPNAKGAPS